MKRMKLSLLKRIFVLFCCTVLLSSSVFSVYSMTVYAADEYNLKDGLEDFCKIALGISGLLFLPEELTFLGFVSILSGVLGAVDGAINIYDYVTDNGDGTYTISSEFVQAVMDAAEQLEAKGFTDANITEQWNGHGYVLRCYSVKTPYTDGLGRLHEVVHELSTDKFTPYCVYPDNNIGSYLLYYYSDGFKNGFISGSYKDSCNNDSGTGFFPRIPECDAFSANVPIFRDMDSVKNYLLTGQGYKDAENYRPTPIFRRHSSYTPTYSGGAVTVNRTVIENITQKITEVDADDSLTDDQKIEKLQEYIRSGGTSDTGGGGGTGGGSGDTDYDDNKDVPSGDDLTDTNSWLKKIYLKLCQISDDFKSFFIFKDAPGINAKYIASLLESIHLQLRSLWDEIHEQLTGISGDLSDIKKQLSNMSEQEFDEKSDSFLGEIMDAFSEISEVVKTKFPFSIPNDLRIFLSKIAPAPPDTEEQQLQSYSLDSSSGISLYSGEHGGGGISDGETNPPGGGGSSRPGSGFVDVEHGGSGGSREPVEMREAPVFCLPIVIESYGIEEYIIIDMSPFDPLSKFSRSFFTIIFLVCLFNLTFKVIGMWGDLIG